MKIWSFSTQVITALLALLPLAANGSDTGSPQQAATRIGAYLQTEIQTKPKESLHNTPGKVQPGTMMQLSAVVKNVGDVPSAPGSIYLRFALPAPLDKQPGSILFETEKENLPSILPGQAITVNFLAPHIWPSVFDFVRNEWAMREYAAVVNIGGESAVTGTLPISFSAYYYTGQNEEKPARFQSADLPTEKPKSRPTASRPYRPARAY